MLVPGAGRGPRNLDQVVEEMAATLDHRGPDERRLWRDEQVAFAVGHTRLSVIDLSASGAQPMRSRDGRYVLSFNGEIYNHRGLRRELLDWGVQFRGSSDTEVLLEAIAKWGLDASLRRISGMFAFALWAVKEKRLWLARDRFGKKPLYYGWVAGSFVFCSELKALRPVRGFQPRVDARAATLFGEFGYVPGGYSIFEGIRKLLPGCFVQVDETAAPGDSVRPVPYWSTASTVLETVARRESATPEKALNLVEDRLLQAIERRMVADVPLGALLSGGIDSSLVVALMMQKASDPVRTFSVGYSESEFDEGDSARQIASHLGAEHTGVTLTPSDALAIIPSLPRLYDEPFADSSQIPTYLISKVARRSVTVALTGDGGDEIFGGYTRYLGGVRLWKAMQSLPVWLRSRISRLLLAVPPDKLALVYRFISAVLPAHFQQRRPGELLHKLARTLPVSDLRDFYLELLTIRGTRNGSAVPDVAGTLIPSYLDARLLDPRDWLMTADTLLYLPDDILTKVDRASMSVGLEIRSPLLDQEVFEAAWALPGSLKFRSGLGKWCLRELLSRHLPAKFLERPKSGFAMPVGEWLCGQLRDWAENFLEPKKLEQSGAEVLLGYPNTDAIRNIWQEHLGRRRNHEQALWTVLMYQAWHEAWVG